MSTIQQRLYQKVLTILLLICPTTSVILAQYVGAKGVPKITTYTPGDFGHIGKVWSIKTDIQNIVYLASDKGLVRFDGLGWQVFKGSAGFTRSVDIVNDSVIITGSDLDFGVWSKDEFGNLFYKSLYPFQEELSSINEEFWNVYALKESYLFVSFQNLYIVKQQQITKVSAPNFFTTTFKIGEELYLVDREEGLFKLSDFSLQKVGSLPKSIASQVVGGFKIGETLTLVTQKMGCWSWTAESWTPNYSNLSSKLAKNQVFSFKTIGDDLMAFGTILSGVFIVNKNGQILHHLHKLKGLVNNTVLSLEFSRNGSLWLGLDYGIAKISLNRGFTYVHDYFGSFGTASSALLQGEQLFLGTNQGLYTIPWNDLDNGLEEFNFKLVPNSEGQVWSIAQIGNSILVGHDKGLFSASVQGLKQLNCPFGVWTTQVHKDFLFVGSYNGIFIYKPIQDSWELVSKMDSIAGSCTQLVFESDQILWINIPNFGVVRAELDDAFQPIKRERFDSSMLLGDDIKLVSDNGIFVHTTHHIYAFDTASNSFQVIKTKSDQKIKFPLLPGNYSGTYLNEKHFFYPIYNGFAIESKGRGIPINYEPVIVIKPLVALSSQGAQHFLSGSSIPFTHNTLRITAFVPNTEDVMYRYSLDKGDIWSEWTNKVDIDLLKLRAGKYLVLVQAMLEDDQIIHTEVNFVIDPPFWLHWYMFPLYILLFLLFIYAVRRSRHRSLKRQRLILEAEEQARLDNIKELHRQELIQLEQEKLMALNDELKNQLKEKTIELATKAKSNEDKSKMIQSLKEVLDSVEKEPSKLKMKWKEIQLLLDNFQGDDDRVFEMQMNELHQEFFQMIKKDFPNLSPSDLRMCAYIKIGLSTKEIADLFQVQPSSAYISRSRLRKKLNLDAEEDLYTFLNRYQNSTDH